MRTKITAEEWSRFFKTLAEKRWRNSTPEQRAEAARSASRIRWARFRKWQIENPEQAAAAAAIAHALRALRPKRVTNDDLFERLEARLSRVRSASRWSPDYLRDRRRHEQD